MDHPDARKLADQLDLRAAHNAGDKALGANVLRASTRHTVGPES
ncbi:MAG: hypothetical protein ACRDTF_06830 [Pseudonocardiaceae bacterium]